jgi:two-component system response regulator AtoC
MPTRSALRALARYAWPGNVRELRAEVARWVVFCDERVDVEDLSPEIRECVEAATSASSSERPHRPTEVRTLAEHVHAVERAVIDETLARNAGNLAKSARELGIDRNTLKRKIRGA